MTSPYPNLTPRAAGPPSSPLRYEVEARIAHQRTFPLGGAASTSTVPSLIWERRRSKLGGCAILLSPPAATPQPPGPSTRPKNYRP